MSEISLESEALRLAREFGFYVLPVRPPTIGNPKSGKIPLIKDWVNQATTDPQAISAWWSRWPDANIGIATGAKSGIAVLDVDPDKGGADSLEKLVAQVRAAEGGWPVTLAVRTGSGGYHFYFRYDPRLNLKNSVSKLGPGLDIRAEGGQVVAPPSLHYSGNRYEWIEIA